MTSAGGKTNRISSYVAMNKKAGKLALPALLVRSTDRWLRVLIGGLTLFRHGGLHFDFEIVGKALDALDGSGDARRRAFVSAGLDFAGQRHRPTAGRRGNGLAFERRRDG